MLSTFITIEHTPNYRQIRVANFPDIQLNLPFIGSCVMCTHIHTKITELYGLHLDKVKIDRHALPREDEDEEYDPSSLHFPHNHHHSIYCNNDLVEMPLYEWKEVVVKTTSVSRKRARSPTPTPTASPIVVDLSTSPDHQDEAPQVAENAAKPVELITRKLSKDEILAKQMSTNAIVWKRSTNERLKKLFITDTVTPHDYQSVFIEHVADWDWSNIDRKKNAFLLCLKVGLGKTLAMLLSLSTNPHKHVVIVCDKSLIGPWTDEIHKVIQFQPDSRTTVEIYGYDFFQRTIREHPKYCERKILVVDEAHKYRTMTPSMIVEMEALRRSQAIFLLTATPLNSTVQDILYLNMFFDHSIPIEPMSLLIKENRLFPENITPAMYKKIYNTFKDRVYFHTLEEEADIIKTNKLDLRVEMTWPQSFEYCLSNNQTTLWGQTKLTSSARNSFDSLTRRVANCHMSKSGEFISSPKSSAAIEFIRKAVEKGHRGVVFSSYLDLGIRCVYKELMRAKQNDNWAKGKRIQFMSSETSTDERNDIQKKFSNGQIDVLCMSPISQTGMNLINAKFLILFESLDSTSNENQTLGRVVRNASKDADKTTVIDLVRLIACFPTKDPSVKDKELIISTFCSYARMSRADYDREQMDIIKEMRRHFKQIGPTADEKRLERNDIKHTKIENLETVLRAASIPSKLSAKSMRAYEAILQQA